MIDTIPDLWPTAAIKTDVLTPVAILRTQATLLGQKTQGLLVAEVTVTIGEKGQVVLGLELIVPALNNYRHRLLSVQHTIDEIYPAAVSAKGLKVTVMDPGMFAQKPHLVTRQTESKIAYSESDFVSIIQEVLQAPDTVALLQSLISRSNEERRLFLHAFDKDESGGEFEQQEGQ